MLSGSTSNKSNIFRSYDIRGIYGQDIDAQTAEQIGRAYAHLVSGKNVRQIIVAHDVRLSSPQLALAFIAGAASDSLKIGFAGMLPLGVVLFHAHRTGAELAYITASHLPAEWNGIKFFHPTGAGWLEDENFALRDAFLEAAPRAPAPPEHEQIAVHEERAEEKKERPTLKDYIQIRRDGRLVAPKPGARKPSILRGSRASRNLCESKRFSTILRGSRASRNRHTVIDPDAATANYIRYLVTQIKPRQRLRVVLDCGNGAASVVAPKLFAAGGFEVKALWAQPDGRFPNRSPDPHSDPLAKLKEAVKSERASLGIAYDGDGDRITVVDDRGQTLSPERTAYFILSELLKTVQGPIVANVECTRAIDDIAARFGRSVIRVPVGHTYLMDAVHRNKAAFGLEVSGHYALPALVPFDDALAISYYLACVLSRRTDSLSAAVAQMPSYPFERINFICADEQKFALIDRLKLKLEKEHANINDMDGLRIDFADGWALIRASNTEPKIRLTIEANTEERFEQLKTEFGTIIEKELHELYKPSIMTKLKRLLKK